MYRGEWGVRRCCSAAVSGFRDLPLCVMHWCAVKREEGAFVIQLTIRQSSFLFNCPENG